MKDLHICKLWLIFEGLWHAHVSHALACTRICVYKVHMIL